MIRSQTADGPEVKLFAVDDESHDLATTLPERLLVMTRELDALLEGARALSVERELSEAEREMLNALGYAVDSPAGDRTDRQ